MLCCRTGAALLALACSGVSALAQDLMIEQRFQALAEAGVFSVDGADVPTDGTDINLLMTRLDQAGSGNDGAPAEWARRYIDAASGMDPSAGLDPELDAGREAPVEPTSRPISSLYEKTGKVDIQRTLQTPESVSKEVMTGLDPTAGLDPTTGTGQPDGRNGSETGTREKAEARELEERKRQQELAMRRRQQQVAQQQKRKQTREEELRSQLTNFLNQLADQQQKNQQERQQQQQQAEQRLAELVDGAGVPGLPDTANRVNSVTSDKNQQSLIDDATRTAENQADDPQDNPGDTVDPGPQDGGDTGDDDPTDPGQVDDGADGGDEVPGDTDPGDTDPGDTDPGDTDPGDADPWAAFSYYGDDTQINDRFDLDALSDITTVYNGVLKGTAGDGSALDGTVSMTFDTDSRDLTGTMTFDAENSLSFSGGFYNGEGIVGMVDEGQTVFGGEVGESDILGHFYGPNADEMGAEWWFEVDQGEMPGTASGVFAGSR